MRRVFCSSVNTDTGFKSCEISDLTYQMIREKFPSDDEIRSFFNEVGRNYENFNEKSMLDHLVKRGIWIL